MQVALFVLFFCELQLWIASAIILHTATEKVQFYLDAAIVSELVRRAADIRSKTFNSTVFLIQ